MQFNDFRSMIDSLARDVPPAFRGGVVAIEVSPKTMPHPLRGDVYTLGECIPLEWSGSGADLQSRIVLYHGSFAALARLGDFDWRAEAWATLTHELRHHIEWRANAAALEAYDWAAEENFKRHEGQPFDPVFYRSGERIAEGIYRVDEDVFIEKDGGSGNARGLDVVWHGRHYRVSAIKSPTRSPVFLSLEGLAEPPPGDAVLVLQRKASLLDLFRKATPPLQRTVTVEPLDG